MSEKFELIILNKLENIETKVEQGLGNLKEEVKDIKQELKNTNQRLDKLEIEVKETKKELKDTNQRLDKLETETKQELKNINQRLDKLEAETKQEFKNINQRLGKLEIELKDTVEVVKYHNQSFTKFDYEINKKIDTLFDAFTITKEKEEVIEENIVSLNTKVFNQDIRIFNLEEKILTA